MASVTPTPDYETASVHVGVNTVIASDNFARVTANGWGVATTGQTWTIATGAAAAFSTTGTDAQITMAASDTYTIELGIPDKADVEVFVEGIQFSAIGVGTAAGRLSVLTRFQNTSNYYRLGTTFGALDDIAGTFTKLSTSIFARSGGTTYSPTGPVTSDGDPASTFVAGVLYNMRARQTGNNLFVRAWSASAPEPTGWNTITSDVTMPNPEAIAISLVTFAGTPVGATMRINTITVTFGSTVNVYRGYPDGSRVLIRDAPFQVSEYVLSTWDHEPPLMTGLSYVATSAEPGATDEYESATIILGIENDGWIKDPQHPVLSVRLDNCLEHSPACLQANQTVFFQRLDTTAYPGTSGILQIVNRDTPVGIAQIRKSENGILYVVSRREPDIPALRDLFAPGRVLLLQLPTRYGWGLDTWGSAYIILGDVTVSRIANIDMSRPYRIWALPYQITDSPANEGPTGLLLGGDVGIPGHTWDDLTATQMTFTQLAATGATWLTLSETIP